MKTDFKKLLKEAVKVIEDLAEQQAMYDDWYQKFLISFKEAIEEDDRNNIQRKVSSGIIDGTIKYTEITTPLSDEELDKLGF